MTKLIYLSDWISCLLFDEQITSIDWEYNHFGPYVFDIMNLVRDDEDLKLESTQNSFGNRKYLIKKSNDNYRAILDKQTEKILNKVIDNTKKLSWTQFIDLIYSTYPVVKSKKYSRLDLIELAKKHKTDKIEMI